ncbi:hypothetical protein GQ53DRAFT_643232 [Thozetella sp. PMI_491]|nr:hypothetical protein GQ53DRAFT_643232 [Thozetella sp. PMI_491]
MLNPYSCSFCRKRKKRCDRMHPCMSCRRASVECVFPSRRPSSRHKAPLGAMERLRYLEAQIEHLKADHGALSSRVPAQGELETNQRIEPGRLAIGNGRSRYMSTSFWASLHEEVEDLKSLLNDGPDQKEEYQLPGMPDEFPSTGQCYSFGFGLSSALGNLMALHPAPPKIPVYWQIFKENCDPLLKVLHIPSIEPHVVHAPGNLGQISRGFEALLFAIYFSAVVSLSEEECLGLLGASKAYLIRIYRHAMEKALSRASFLETTEIMVLQAFVLFLTGLRNHCSIQLMWTLTALAVRLAQNAGLHRDGTHYKLTPYAVEMRRRLWWSICVLDSRAAEDSGYDGAIAYAAVDTLGPTNIDDASLTVTMTEMPESRVGITEATFSTVRFEATKVFYRLIQHAPAGQPGISEKDYTPEALAEQMACIEESEKQVEERYLKHCNLSDPLPWYISTISKLVTIKMRLIAHHPFLRKRGRGGLSQEARDGLFTSAIECVEHWLRLNTEVRTRKWRWLCETYIQWYAITFLLTELCVRTKGKLVDRAWSTVEAGLQLGENIAAASRGTNPRMNGHSVVREGTDCDAYKPLMKLLARARSARRQAVAPLDEESGCMVVEDMIYAGASSVAGLVFDAGDLVQIGAGFDGLVLGDQPPLEPLPSPPDDLGTYQGWSLDYGLYPPPHLQVNAQMSDWGKWQLLPEMAFSG